MQFGEWINQLPLWFVFVLNLALCMAASEAGVALARLVLRRNEKEPDTPLGTLVAALMGLFAFFLAFTFGMSAARFDVRRQLVLDEANSLGTTYLRAGLLPPKQGVEVRRLLRDYADRRMNTTTKNLHDQLARAQDLQSQLWSQAESLVREEMDSELRSLFVKSLNELIDLHQSRKTVGLEYRIPGSIWFVVYLLSVLSMLAVGYQVGMAGTKRLRGMPIVATAFSLVIVLIADVDRPGEGLMRVSQQPFADVRQMMHD